MKNGAWEYPLRSLSGFSGFWRSPIRKGSKCHSGCSFSSFLHSPSFLSKHNSGIVFYLFCCFWKLKLIVQNRIVISTFYASNERTDDSSRTNPQHGMLLCAASDIKDIHPLRPSTNMRYLWAWFWEQRRCQRGEQGAAPTEILAPRPHLHAPLPAVRLHALTGTVRSVSDPDVYWLSSVGNKHSYSCVQNTDRISEYISVCHWTVLLVSGMLLAVVFDYRPTILGPIRMQLFNADNQVCWLSSKTQDPGTDGRLMLYERFSTLVLLAFEHDITAQICCDKDRLLRMFDIMF